MSAGRSLLTDTQKEVLTGERDASYSHEAKMKSVIRERIRGLQEDMEILEEDEPEVYALMVQLFRAEIEGDDVPGVDV